MTSKNSCFDRAIFRRSLRRTAPVWGLFCLYELLLPLRLYSYCRGVSVCTEDFFVQAERTILENAVTGASIVPFVYGGLLAWALFSWLFRTNSAYFYAALPVRRRTLFLTNYLTGLLLCAAPALVSSLLLWAVGAGFGVSAFCPRCRCSRRRRWVFCCFSRLRRWCAWSSGRWRLRRSSTAC